MEQNTASSNTPNVEFLHKDKSVTNLIFGIVSLVISALPLFSIGGIVFGALALKRSAENKSFALTNGLTENGMNTAGYVTGLIGLILSAIFTVLYVLAIVAIVVLALNVSTAVAANLL
ncbi:MAG: hypothetical protein IJF41_06215 [Clostridia bacterium]|nr:hypothetical protein [Clostridia bacterium]